MPIANYCLFFWMLLILIGIPSNSNANSSSFRVEHLVEAPVQPLAKGMSKKKQKQQKRKLAKKSKADIGLLISTIFWYGLVPAAILAVLVLGLWLPLIWLYGIGLGMFSVWAGFSGIVYFPLQFIGLPLGIAIVLFGIIFQMPLAVMAGIAVVGAALIAFLYMLIMFTKGAKKNLAKAKKPTAE